MTHTFGTPTTLTSNSVADGNPAVYADELGKLYVVWLRDTADGANMPVYATFNGTAWSARNPLPLQGVAPGTVYNDVAIGSQALGRVDVLMTTRSKFADGTNDSRLVDRLTTRAGFDQPTALTTIASGAQFSHVSTAKGVDGSLAAYWQQNDGTMNEIFLSHTGTPDTPGASNWSIPAPLTASAQHESVPAVQQNPDGSWLALFEVHDLPPGAAPAAIPGTAGLSISATDMPLSGSVGGNDVRPAPEITFSRPMFFPFETAAELGAVETAAAQIQNTGLKSDQVRIDYLRLNGAGAPTVLGSDTVTLDSGQTLDITHDFAVLAGTTTYAFRVTPLGGEEEFSNADNLSSATISGKPDVEVTAINLPDVPPAGGQTITVNVHVVNNANQAVGPFTLSLYEGNPDLAGGAARLIADVPVQLFARSGQDVPIQYTVPVSGGDVTLFAIADSTNVLDEAVEANNTASTGLSVRGNARISDGDLSATVLSQSGVQNVRVRVMVHNTGNAALTNVPVQIFSSLDDAPLAPGQVQTIGTIPAHGTANLDFLVNGFGGTNHYRVVVSPGAGPGDSDDSDNVAEINVTLQGLPDLQVQGNAFNVNPASPVQGKPAAVQATLLNAGIGNAGAFRVVVYARPGTQAFNPLLDTATQVGALEVAGLQPLQSAPLTIPIDTSSLGLGDVTFALVIDPTQDLTEATTGNNLVVEPSRILPPTPPTVLSAAYDDSEAPGRIVFHMDTAMNPAINASALVLTSNGTPINGGQPSYEAATHTITFTLPDSVGAGGALPAGSYSAVLQAAGISDGHGLRLDGNADGTEGDNYTFNFAVTASVVARQVFYNRSVFDGNDAAANAADDNAIATDKTALLPGQAATFANYTSYDKGINGIMLDVAKLGSQTLTAADFTFRVGTDNNLAGWTLAPAPSFIVVRPLAGNRSRVDIVFPDGSIVGKWLQVTLKATANTGLAAPDVSYFGNQPGETGDSPTLARVNALDVAALKRGLGTTVGVTSRFDQNRDGRINALDVASLKRFLGRSLTLISPAPLAGAAASGAAALPTSIL